MPNLMELQRFYKHGFLEIEVINVQRELKVSDIKQSQEGDETRHMARRTAKNSVFLDLFQNKSYHEYFQRTSQNYYKSKKVKMPKPELYVIFAGNRGSKPDIILLSKNFLKAQISILK